MLPAPKNRFPGAGDRMSRPWKSIFRGVPRPTPPLEIDYQGRFVGQTASEKLFSGAAQGVIWPWKCFSGPHKKYSDLKYGFPLYCSIELVRNRMSTILFYRVSVDAKINALESEGKCSPSSRKSTKRVSQFDL